MALTFESREEGDTIFLVPDGEMDVSGSPPIKDELNRLISEGRRRIVLDMTKVSYMDSSGLGALVNVHKALGARGMLALIGCRPAVERVLRFTQFDRVLQIYRTFEDYEQGNRDNLRAVSGVSKSVIAKQKAAPHTAIQKSPERPNTQHKS
jgi:anti-sigma B factor antagonist